MFKTLVIVAALLSVLSVGTVGYSKYSGGPVLGLAVLKPVQGGTGVGTAAPSDVGKVFKVSDDSPFTVTLQDDNTGAGGSFPFTPTSWGNSTSSVLGLLGGVFSNASSTFHILKAGTASTTNLIVSSLNTANCDLKADSTGNVTCGTDATGAGGGSGTVSTSTNESKGFLAYWASDSATPALLGEVATTSLTISSPLTTSGTAGALVGGSNLTIGIDTSGTWSGNAGTASALAADPANCSAGNAPLGITTTGAVEGCFDVWTEAENTSAAYVPGTRALTVAGTANQITSSAGSQNLTADRTWTLSLPNHVIFPGSYVAGTGTTTNATSTFMNVVSHLRSEGTTRFDQLTSALVLTGSTGVAGEYAGANCTNQVIEDLDALGAPTCVSINNGYWFGTDLSVANGGTGLSTFGGTNTILYTTAADALSSEAAFTYDPTTNLLSVDNLAISATGFLVLPATADPTVNAAGELALDTTSGNIIFATSTAQELVLGGATTTLYAMVIASTSPDFASGGVIPLPTHFLKQQAVGIICKVDGGTSQVINLDDGTNNTNSITCSTTETQYTFTANNIWNPYETINLEFGAKTGSPDYLVIRVVGFRTSD